MPSEGACDNRFTWQREPMFLDFSNLCVFQERLPVGSGTWGRRRRSLRRSSIPTITSKSSSHREVWKHNPSLNIEQHFSSGFGHHSSLLLLFASQPAGKPCLHQEQRATLTFSNVDEISTWWKYYILIWLIYTLLIWQTSTSEYNHCLFFNSQYLIQNIFIILQRYKRIALLINGSLINY